MEMSAVAENACMGEPPPNPLGGDNGVGRGQELLLWRRPCTSRSHPLEELYNPDGGLEVPGCWDRCDKEEGKEEQSSPTFNFQWRVSSVVHGYQCLFTLRHFLPVKLLSKLKVVNDNLPLCLLQLGYRWAELECTNKLTHDFLLCTLQCICSG